MGRAGTSSGLLGTSLCTVSGCEGMSLVTEMIWTSLDDSSTHSLIGFDLDAHSRVSTALDRSRGSSWTSSADSVGAEDDGGVGGRIKFLQMTGPRFTFSIPLRMGLAGCDSSALTGLMILFFNGHLDAAVTDETSDEVSVGTSSTLSVVDTSRFSRPVDSERSVRFFNGKWHSFSTLSSAGRTVTVPADSSWPDAAHSKRRLLSGIISTDLVGPKVVVGLKLSHLSLGWDSDGVGLVCWLSFSSNQLKRGRSVAMRRLVSDCVNRPQKRKKDPQNFELRNDSFNSIWGRLK